MQAINRTRNRTSRRNPRQRRRRHQITGLEMASRPTNLRTLGSVDPPMINNTICVVYKARGQFLTTATLPFLIFPATIAALLPGGSGTWRQFRLIKIEIWGDDAVVDSSVSLEIGTVPSSGPSTMRTKYNSDGVQGQRRGHVSVLLGSTFSLSWYTSTDTTTQLASLSTDYAGPSFYIICDITLQLVTVEAPSP